MKQATRPHNGWEEWTPEGNTAYRGLPDGTYRKVEAISKSTLALLGERRFGRGGSPLHMRHEQANPTPPSEAMLLGSALDCYLLEPEEWDSRYVLDETGWSTRTKAWKDYWKVNARGRRVLSPETMERIEGMNDAVRSHPWGRRLLESSVSQVSAFWEEGGTSCKGRLDLYDPSTGIITDLKTAQDASPQGFQRAVKSFRYHMQAAAYLSGMRACGELVRQFLFLVVESAPPHGTAVYELAPPVLQTGVWAWNKGLEAYRRCLEAEEWPGYSQEILRIKRL